MKTNTIIRLVVCQHERTGKHSVCINVHSSLRKGGNSFIHIYIFKYMLNAHSSRSFTFGFRLCIYGYLLRSFDIKARSHSVYCVLQCHKVYLSYKKLFSHRNY